MHPAEKDLGVMTGGVWTAADARASGLSKDVVRHRRESGLWQVLRTGVYTDAGHDPTAVQRAWAAVLAARGDGDAGRALATGRTAARLLGAPLVDDDDPLLGRRDAEHDDVVVFRALRPTRTLHPRRPTLPRQAEGLLRGVPCVSPLRTVVDLQPVVTHEALVCVLDDLLHREVVTRADLAGLVEQRRRQPGGRALADAVALADGRAESPLETLERLILLPVLPRLEPQVRVHDGRGRRLARLDLGDRALRFGVEGDGKAGHAGARMLSKDRRREERLRRVGWLLERGDWYDVRRGQDAFRDRVVRRAAERGRAA